MESYDEMCKMFPNLDGLALINESKFDPSRCIFFYNGKIIKSRKINKDVSSQLRQNDLKLEFEILMLCPCVKEVPSALHYCMNDKYEILFVEYVSGTQLINLKLSFGLLIKLFQS